MAEQHTRDVFGRIRDKIASRFSRPHSPRPLGTAYRTTRPREQSFHNLPSASNPPPPNPLLLRGNETPFIPHSTIVGEQVNLVGHDQFNVTSVTNVTTHIHTKPDLGAEEVNRLGANVERTIGDSLFLASPQHPLFDKLSHVVKASYDASTPALRRACTEKTRTAVLEAIQEWAIDITKPKIYWMNGMAGTGKTTISYSVSIILKAHNILGATFFCSRLVDECTKVDRIFPTIAYNLSRHYPPLASTILKALKHDPDVANRTINQQFTDLLVKPTREAAKDLAEQPIVVVIDALDECANQAEVQTFLSIICQRSSELPFKFFITSRPEQLVRVGFNRQDPANYARLILHDIERDIVTADIKLYVAERLVEMVDGRSDFQDSEDDWPPEDKVDILARRANRLFIYAKTVCDYIGEPGGNISENINAVALPVKENTQSGATLDTGELDILYRDILDRAVPRRPEARDRLRQVLAAVISIRNPLSARGLGALLEIDPGAIKSALASLHSVISVPQSLGDPVSTFHASFPDCLTERTRSHQHFLCPSNSHRLLAKSCLSLMNSSLKENICNLEGRPANDTIVNETITAHITEGLAYACVYWASHLTAVRKEEIQAADDLRESLNEFLLVHLLHWMECLSLLGRLDVAIEALRMIEGWVLGVYPESIALAIDARRFALENFELICRYCLETYHSALVWLPVQCAIRKHYTTKKSDLPKVLVGLRNVWGSCEKVIDGLDHVFSVAFSSDGRHIVSGLYKKGVRIWNAMTGEPEGVLEGHSDAVLSVAVLNDGSRIVSGSKDKTIRIWNAVTGESERVLKGHSSEVSSVAFSSDGGLILSGSNDTTVRIWNAVTGELEGVLEGHSGGVLSAAFSNDGGRVVSGSEDKTVRTWNVVTFESENVLEGHPRPVRSVTFSNDGSRIVSGSEDGTVRIWNAVTGELERILEGHSSTVGSLAFSSDGGHIVSGSFDSTVRIWNVVTGELEYILEGHSSLVSSVATSSNQFRVASGSYDRTIRIWDVLTGKPDRSLKGHSGGVLTVAFSNDGCRVASGSKDETIMIWNVVTGEPEGVLDGHSDAVISVAFSNDGSHIASGSRDGTARIWNAVTGRSEGILKCHSGWVLTVAFSSNGNHVVSGSDGGTVQIWSTVTGELEGVLEGHSKAVISVAFSNDGSRVVSGSEDRTVRIWNAVTGELEYYLDHLSVTRDGLPSVRLSDKTEIRYQLSGNFDISTTSMHSVHSCTLSDDDAWIQTDSVQRSCWVPQQYRDFYCTSSLGSKISFGFNSGIVVVLDLTGT